MEYYVGYLIVYLIILIPLSYIPASIAKRKGRDFTTWYIYAFLLWIVAFIHAVSLPELPSVQSTIETKRDNLTNNKLIAEKTITSININCPVEILGWQLYLSENLNNVFCKVKFRNLQKGTIKAIKFDITCFNSFGEQIKQETGNTIRGIIQDLNIGANTIFGENQNITIENSDTRNILIDIVEILFMDNNVWKNAESNIVETDIKCLSGSQLANLKSIVGEDACCYPDKRGEYWVCTCGRYNYDSDITCSRCFRDKEKIFNSYTKETVEDEATKRIESKRIETEKAQAKQLQIQKEQENRKHILIKKASIISSCILTVVIIVTVLFVQFALPPIRYSTANNLMKQHEYANAVTIFQKIDGYKDSNVLAKECNYQFAISNYNNLTPKSKISDYENVQKMLTNLNGYKDSAAKADEIDNAIKWTGIWYCIFSFNNIRNSTITNYGLTDNGSVDRPYLIIDYLKKTCSYAYGKDATSISSSFSISTNGNTLNTNVGMTLSSDSAGTLTEIDGTIGFLFGKEDNY